ncbi:hypothetical protein [Sulfitobacter sp. JB4-11]|uniref:hypothetical protein n=1 Tax=Sulfitobacter rhodophyticola TaxID=3238304 RepID=UPI0035197D00
MTNAPALLNHALRMLVHDPAVTLRILMPGLLLIVASSIGITYFMPGQMWSPTLTPDQVEMIEPSDAGGVLLAGLAGVVGYILTAVIWHRHVLLTGAARETPLFPGVGVMGSYLWRAIIVALVQIAAALPILAVTGLIATVVSLFLAGFLAGIIFFWLALRISLILPAAAMGRQMRIAESWQATAPLAGPLWGVAAMLSILSAVLALVIGMLTGAGSTANIALQNVSFIVEALISISVLTTLYGHLIEGRPLG